jgi:dynein heavy chain
VRKEIRTRPKAEMEQVLGKNPPKVDGLTIPLNVFLFQEIERLNNAIGNVRRTLTQLQQAIRGETIVTPDLQLALDLIYMAKPPRNWYTAPAGDLIAWVSPSLALWMTGLLDRDRQLRTWLGTGRPVTYWLTGFFNPQGFMTAMRQEVTRKHSAEKWALDDVVLHADVMDQDDPKRLKGPADEGVYVHGLYLEGCVWDKAKKVLAESAPKELFSPLPILWITALTSERRKTALGVKQYYNCPIYTQTKRTGQFYVIAVTMRTDRDPQHWTMRGVALLCDTS